ncbi:hypothetical protein V8G54_001655 [Vigna mungo]|uniref:Uncharacterized protein n=1 Tax=Vigna mungo TaxID=3915 RepID=A0AAQ3P6Q0_VIGMU
MEEIGLREEPFVGFFTVGCGAMKGSYVKNLEVNPNTVLGMALAVVVDTDVEPKYVKQVSNGKLAIEQCMSEVQLADLFTKATKSERFKCLRDAIRVFNVNTTLTS